VLKNNTNSSSCIRIVVSGSECTGKTTLVKELAAVFRIKYSTEGARDYVNNLGRPIEYRDVESIAQQQIGIEDKLGAGNSQMILLDTDLFSTLIYSNFYFGKCPYWIKPLCIARRADLYLLCEIDLPWIEEQFQRGHSTPNTRQNIHNLFVEELKKNSCNILRIYGQGSERLKQAIFAIHRNIDDQNNKVDQCQKSS